VAARQLSGSAGVPANLDLASAPEKEKLIVFDTSLRDGEQSPGVTLGLEQKLLIARQLSRLGVTVCEAGFPIASEGDFQCVNEIAKEVGHITEGRPDGVPMVICGLARAVEADIERCYEAVSPAQNHRIHTFLATSDLHLEYKLQISREQCLEQIDKMVRFAASICGDIEFSPEDAGRTDPEFLVQALEVAIAAGASTLNIPDTVGYNTPEMYGGKLKYLIDNTIGADKAVWSTHCHNDLGLATANTLAGITAGCRQMEVTINGIGERAGNTALEEVVMAINVHPTEYPVYTDIDTTQLTLISNTVASLSGMNVQKNKAIVGANAFSHESGIHQDGYLKNQETYEIMRPETVGLYNHDGMVLGKLSGRAAFKQRMSAIGYPLEDADELKRAFVRFKAVADGKNNVNDGDLHAIMRDVVAAEGRIEYWKLKSCTVVSGSAGGESCTATVSIENPQGELQIEAAVSRGPIDAMYQAIDRIVNIDADLRDYRIEAVGAGSDALGEVAVLVSKKGTDENGMFSGAGADGDVLKASAMAYINALNSLYAVEANLVEVPILAQDEMRAV